MNDFKELYENAEARRLAAEQSNERLRAENQELKSFKIVVMKAMGCVLRKERFDVNPPIGPISNQIPSDAI